MPKKRITREGEWLSPQHASGFSITESLGVSAEPSFLQLKGIASNLGPLAHGLEGKLGESHALFSSDTGATLGAHISLFPPIYETSLGPKISESEKWVQREICGLNPTVETGGFVGN